MTTLRNPLINVVGGVPTLMAGAWPLPAPIYDLYYGQADRGEVIRTLCDHGVGAFAVRTNIGNGQDEQTNQSVDLTVERLKNVASHAPDAWLIVDALVFSSERWLLVNPDERYMTFDGQLLVNGRESLVEGVHARHDYVKVPGPSIEDAKGELIQGEDPALLYGRGQVSAFSKRFAVDAGAVMVKLIEAVKATGLADRFWGVFLEAYHAGEWNLGRAFPDHSVVALKGFQDHIKDKYKNEEALRKAWMDVAADFGAAPPDEFSDLEEFGSGAVKDTDYREAEAAGLAAQFRTIAEAVRKADARLGVGGFFHGMASYQTNSEEIYSSSSVDFFATPLAYENRGLGSATNSQSVFCDSAAAFGKVWFDELDVRTHMANRDYYHIWGMPDDADGSVEMLWRDAGQMLIRGHHGWWLDFGGSKNHHADQSGVPPYSWHTDPKILEFHHQFSTVWRRLPEFDRTPLGEIKVFTPAKAFLNGANTWQRHVEWGLIGAPVEYDMLENLFHGRSELGKLNLFLLCGELSVDECRQLRKTLAGTECVCVWVDPQHRRGGPTWHKLVHGMECDYIDVSADTIPFAEFNDLGEERVGVNSGTLCGQFLRELKTGNNFTLRAIPSGVDRDNAFPCPFPLLKRRRLFHVSDVDAHHLAVFKEFGMISVAMKRTDDVQHVIYSLPILNTNVLKAFAKFANCHLFTEKEAVVHASKGLFLLHSTYAGKHVITFPKPIELHDLRNDRRLMERGRRHEFQLERGKTILLKMLLANRQ